MRQKSVVRLVLEPIGMAIALGLLARTFLQIYAIPSASMHPTLRAGDRVVVTRFGAPFIDHTVRRGDVVVFRSPHRQGEVMIKRVIAVPGELIETRLGRIVIGGRTLAEPYVAEAAMSGSIEPTVVPGNTYFVAGDNRANSIDSRQWGPIPHSLIIGRARLVLWTSAESASARNAHASTAPATNEQPPKLGALGLFRMIE